MADHHDTTGAGVPEELWVRARKHLGDLCHGDAECMQRAATEIERLRAGIEAYLNGDYPSPRDHRPGKCEHGTHYWEPCEQCVDQHFTRLLADDDATNPR